MMVIKEPQTAGMALEQLSDVVQRCQSISDDSYTSEDVDVFMTAAQTCIEEGNSAQVLSIVLDEQNQNLVRYMGWNLLPALLKILLKKEDRTLPQCLAIFNHMLETCNPKELLIGLWEQLEQDDSDTVEERLHLLMSPLQKVLLRLGDRKAMSLGMTLSSLLDQVSKLPVPHTKEQEEDDVFSLCRCCSDLAAFVRPFVLEVKQTLRRKDELSESMDKMAIGPDAALDEELRTELLKFCMRTLSEPLLEVQLHDPDTLPGSPLRDYALEILTTLSGIGEPLSSLVFHPLLGRKQLAGFLEEEARYPTESLANLAHMVFVHHLAADSFPSVYSPVFSLRCNMEHVSILLSRNEDMKIQKGLELYEKSLVRVENDSLSADLLEIKSFRTVPESLVKVMTYCERSDLKTKGLKVFQMSMDKFNTEAKYNFFQYMMKASSHSGVQGYIIKNIKNQIAAALQPGKGNTWFLGSLLRPLLHKVLLLPDGPETDLLHYMDRVMESLSLLRYLVIRDTVTQNQTGIWNELQKIRDTFLKPLRVGLNMSKAHYERELHNTMDSKKSKVKEESILSVSVGGEELPDASPESAIQGLHAALCTFDMMESVLVRIDELTDVNV